MLLDLTGILFNTEHSDIFYIVVVVVVTLLALAVLCLIEMTESRVSNEAIFKLRLPSGQPKSQNAAETTAKKYEEADN